MFSFYSCGKLQKVLIIDNSDKKIIKKIKMTHGIKNPRYWPMVFMWNVIYLKKKLN